MKKPSRTMQPVTRPPLGWGARLGQVFFLVGFVALLVYQPLILAAIGVMVVLSIVLGILDHRRLSWLAAERQGESICTFAKSFDYRAIDTWIIRAVFEELQPWCKSGRLVMPLRAADDLEGVLNIDLEDLEELFFDIADRSRRSTEDCDRNPLFGKVKTVSDLVSFLVHQPSKKTA